MPTIKEFGSFSIHMYYKEHGHPHFHVLGSDFAAKVLIDELAVVRGKLPPKVYKKAVAFARDNHELLIAEWNRLKDE